MATNTEYIVNIRAQYVDVGQEAEASYQESTRSVEQLLKYGHINVGGWIKNNHDLRMLLLKSVDAWFVETHLGKNERLDLKEHGYEWYEHNRYATLYSHKCTKAIWRYRFSSETMCV